MNVRNSFVYAISLLTIIPPLFADDIWLFRSGLIMSIGLIYSVIFLNAEKSRIRIARPYLYWSITVLMVCSSSILWSVNSWLAFRRLMILFAWIIIVSSLIHAGRNKKFFIDSVLILSMTGLFSSLTGFIVALYPDTFKEFLPNIAEMELNWKNLLAGFHYNKNFHASFLAMIFPWIMLWPGRVYKNENIISYQNVFKSITLILFLIIIITSAGATLGITASLLTVLMIVRRKWKKKIFVITSAVVLISALLWALDYPPEFWRLEDRGHRIIFWNTAIEMFRENPFIGKGLEQYGVHSQRLHTLSGGFGLSPSINAHNDYFQAAGELGMTGLILSITPPLFLIVYIMKNRRYGYLFTAGSASLTVFFVHAAVSYPSRMPLSLAMAAFSASAVMVELLKKKLISEAVIENRKLINIIGLIVIVVIFGNLIDPAAAVLNYRAKADSSEIIYNLSHIIRPDDPLAAQGLAERLIELGYTDKAEEVYRETLRYNPWRSTLLYNLGNLLLLESEDSSERIKKLEEAEKCFKKTSDLSSNGEERGRAFFNLALIAEMKSEITAAEKFYRSSIESWNRTDNSSESYKPYANLGILMLRKRQFLEGLSNIEKSLAINPEQPQIQKIRESAQLMIEELKAQNRK